jgi:hypothetical protein
MHVKFLAPIWENQNRRSNHFLFQCVEALLALFCPLKLTIFLQKLLHGCCDLCITFNELPVVCANAVHSCLIDIGGGKSTIMAILDGSTNNPYLQTIWPSNTPKGEKKMHFFRFREI